MRVPSLSIVIAWIDFSWLSRITSCEIGSSGFCFSFGEFSSCSDFSSLSYRGTLWTRSESSGLFSSYGMNNARLGPAMPSSSSISSCFSAPWTYVIFLSKSVFCILKTSVSSIFYLLCLEWIYFSCWSLSLSISCFVFLFTTLPNVNEKPSFSNYCSF